MITRLKSFFVVTVFIALNFYSASVFSASIEYLYLEANEGSSSGGHSALQLGDEIYHYQHHDSGLIRLLRQDELEFHFMYRFLQNRPIHISHIQVSEQNFKKLSEYFKLQFLAQEQQFKQLDELHKDSVFLRYLIYKKNADSNFLDTDLSSVLRLKGVGLFYNKQDLDSQHKGVSDQDKGIRLQSSVIIERLEKEIEHTYGLDFISFRREKISYSIKKLMPNRWPKTTPILSKDNFPPVITSFADSYTDNIIGLIAIKVLKEKPLLNLDAYFITDDPITVDQRKVLGKFRDQLISSLIELVNSERPDWGYAVLIDIARIVAIDNSLSLGVWVFIDDYAMDSEWLSVDQFDHHASKIQVQIDDALTNLIGMRNIVVSSNSLTESNYSKLEMAANRYFELLKAKRPEPVRYSGEHALPTKSTSLPEWIIPEITQKQLTTALNELESYEALLLQALTELYQYNLITLNCVTELFKNIDRALQQEQKSNSKQSESIQMLTKENFNQLGDSFSNYCKFIPFLSFQSLQDRYDVTKSELFKSYRNKQLDKLYAQKQDIISILRESNTLTSTLYDYNSDDSFFMFFTDDNVIFRPVFGVFNAAAGISQSVLGLLTWPFDSGKNLELGMAGILMSLPELFYFNIRKGTYKYLSYSQFLHDGMLHQ